MGAFYLYQKGINLEHQLPRVRRVFRKKGFREEDMVTLDLGLYNVDVYPKINHQSCCYGFDSQGNAIVVAGTLFLDDRRLTDAGQLLDRLCDSHIESLNLRGAFVILWYCCQTEELKIIQDSTGIFRVYANAKIGVFSTSFLAVFATSKNQIDSEAITYNLLLGFMPGRMTWSKSICRVLPGDYVFKKLRSYGCATNKVTDLQHLPLEERLLHILSPLAALSYDQFFLGISAGYDSRLLLALLEKIGLKGLNLFTFFKKGDPDLIYSRLIAEQVKLPLKVVATDVSNKATEEVFEKCFYFFDGCVHTMMQYSKEEYSLDFRQRLFPTGNFLQFSGISGEIFRNYNNDPRTNLSIESWIVSFIISPWLFNAIDPECRKDILEFIGYYLRENLGITDEKVSFETRKRYYAHLYVRDWHSLRNSIENQFSDYSAPFTFNDIVACSYDYAREQGYGGRLEAELINRLNPGLASVQSNYGYSFTRYGRNTYFQDFMKAQLNRSVFAIPKARYSYNKFNSRQLSLTSTERAFLESIRKYHLPVDIDVLLKSGVKKEQVISTAYGLEKLTSL